MIAAMKSSLPQLMFLTFISMSGSGDVVATAAALPTQYTDEDLDFSHRLYFRRPPPPPLYTNDLYVDQFVEVFTRRCTSPSYLLSDDEVDRIIRCDFDPSLKECEEFVKTTTEGRVEQKSLTTTTTGTPDISTTRLSVTTQLNDEDSTTEAIKTTTTRAGRHTTTFRTTTNLPRTTTITSATTPTTPSTITTTNEASTEDLPFFPTSSADSERSVFPDHNDYYDYDEEGDGK